MQTSHNAHSWWFFLFEWWMGGWVVSYNICFEFLASTCHSISSISVTEVTTVTIATHEETPWRPCETLWKRQRSLQTLWQRHIVILCKITSSRICTCQRQVSLKRKLQLLHCRGAYFIEVLSIARSFAIIFPWNLRVLLSIWQPVTWDHYLRFFFQHRYKGVRYLHHYCLALCQPSFFKMKRFSSN